MTPEARGNLRLKWTRLVHRSQFGYSKLLIEGRKAVASGPDRNCARHRAGAQATNETESLLRFTNW